MDIATQQIPLYYGYTHYALAQGYAMMGDSLKANKEMVQFDRYLRLGELRSKR